MSKMSEMLCTECNILHDRYVEDVKDILYTMEPC